MYSNHSYLSCVNRLSQIVAHPRRLGVSPPQEQPVEHKSDRPLGTPRHPVLHGPCLDVLGMPPKLVQEAMSASVKSNNAPDLGKDVSTSHALLQSSPWAWPKSSH